MTDSTPQPGIIATLAHELRSPLMSLTASCELISENLETLSIAEARKMLSAAHRRAVWLNDLVDSVLNATTHLSGVDQLNCGCLQLADVLSAADLVASPLLLERKQRLRVSGVRQVRPFVADRQRVAQALINLITNAAKFSPDESVIDIRCTQLEQALRVEVCDRGPGVVPGRVDHLFQPFVRSASSANGPNSGVGLGLAYVKLIVDAHGGSVGASPRRGGGARFWFVLPQSPRAGQI